MSALRAARQVAASTVVAGMLIGGNQLVVGTLAQARTTTMVATTSVNVRSGPSTATSVIGALSPGQEVTATGPARGGWYPVLFQGRKGFVSAAYLRARTAVVSSQVSDSSGRSAGTAHALESVNVRVGAGLSNRVFTVLPKGASVTLTGRTERGWSQVRMGGRILWINSAWLTRSRPSSAPLPTTTRKARATTALMIRTAPGSKFTNLGDIPQGTVLNLTGKKQQGVAQIVWQGALRWVNANYLASVSSTTSAPVAPKAPATIGSRYARVALNLRTSSSGPGMVGEVPAGTRLAVTGVVTNGRAQVVVNGAERWVTAMYLSLSSPNLARSVSGSLNTGGSSGLDSLVPAAKAIVGDVRANYPQIATMYGVRSDPLPDHPSGHAVDIMLPNYQANKALGWQIARHVQANAGRLGVKYIIFDQHIWSVARSSEGWRPMADRGSDNANHMNHVHVTVN
ncbi:SH3 domain-containing protein [Luteococcus peritonei]|uniref:SH3 domain-containing protein n=1 Tax=Luteococcus peritonei TaxID=88874 RepID=A0ABW4RXH3_9ACTN